MSTLAPSAPELTDYQQPPVSPTTPLPGVVLPSLQLPPRRPEDDSALNAASAIAGITQAAGKNIPLLGIGKEIAKYVMKTAEVRKSFKTMALDPLANPITLGHLMDTATNFEWRQWLPETIKDFCELKDEDVLQLDKLMAIQVALTNPDVFDEWPLFVACNSAFNHRRANFQWLDQPTFLEAAWTCHVLRALRPNAEFSPGVVRFLCALMVEEGLVFFPWTGTGITLDDSESGQYVRGLTEVSSLAKEAKKVWDSGVLDEAATEADGVDEEDPLHVQIARLVAAQAYIKAQEN
jgi:hypothetical protein